MKVYTVIVALDKTNNGFYEKGSATYQTFFSLKEAADYGWNYFKEEFQEEYEEDKDCYSSYEEWVKEQSESVKYTFDIIITNTDRKSKEYYGPCEKISDSDIAIFKENYEKTNNIFESLLLIDNAIISIELSGKIHSGWHKFIDFNPFEKTDKYNNGDIVRVKHRFYDGIGMIIDKPETREISVSNDHIYKYNTYNIIFIGPCKDSFCIIPLDDWVSDQDLSDVSEEEKKLYEPILKKLDELSRIDSEKSYTDDELNLMVHKYFVTGELE